MRTGSNLLLHFFAMLLWFAFQIDTCGIYIQTSYDCKLEILTQDGEAVNIDSNPS